jgi:Fic family protein
MIEWIRESNLIEGVDEPEEDRRSLRAWNWLIKQPFITLDILLTLHRKIMRKKLGREAGHLRTCNVYVGNRTCPHYEQVPQLLHYWLHGSAKTDSPERAHVEFEKIHPFVDGNGRTGRMIMNWQRVHNNLEPLCILADHRWAYYEWFEDKSCDLT